MHRLQHRQRAHAHREFSRHAPGRAPKLLPVRDVRLGASPPRHRGRAEPHLTGGRLRLRSWWLSIALIGCAHSPAATTPGTATGPAAAMQIPVQYRTLPNGLRVVISRDTTAPTVVVAVYYHIGFPIEPRDRAGVAHLFE